MNREVLSELLHLLGFSAQSYDLYWRGETVDDWEVGAMTHEPDGWHVFYAERGERTSERVHATESDACEDFLFWTAKTCRGGQGTSR